MVRYFVEYARLGEPFHQVGCEHDSAANAIFWARQGEQAPGSTVRAVVENDEGERFTIVSIRRGDE